MRSDHASQHLAEHIYDRRLKGDFLGGEVIEAAVDVIEPIGSQSILLMTVRPYNLSAILDSQSTVRPHAKKQYLRVREKAVLFDMLLKWLKSHRKSTSPQ